MTLSLVVLVGLLALDVDFGWAYYRKIACKTAADAAVTAAARSAVDRSTYTVQTNTACPSSLSSSVPLQVGCMYAQANGFTNGGSQTVSMAAGTTGSPVTGLAPSYWITATVSESIPTGFGRIFGNALTPTASSSSGVFQGTPSGCIYVLDGTSTRSLYVSGGASITTGCGIQVNSTSTQGLYLDGGAVINTTGGSKTKIAASSYYLGGGASITPAVVPSAGQVTDPWASMPVPAAGACQPFVAMGNADVRTISPGCYSSIISVAGAAKLTLNAGTYVLQGGFNISNAGVMNANGGVTLYIGGGSAKVVGAGVVNLTAPSTGTYKGVLLWQAATDANAATLSNGGSEVLNGLLYFPGATLNYAGAGVVTGSTATLVAKKIAMTGSGRIDYPAATPYSPGSVDTVSIIR